MNKTEVQIEVESLENGNVQCRIGRDEKLLIGFEITKEQMLTVFEALTQKIANEESGGVTLTFDEQAEKR